MQKSRMQATQGFHTAAEYLILKMLLSEGEVTAEERTGLGHFFKI
jgi:hypothetical protein